MYLKPFGSPSSHILQTAARTAPHPPTRLHKQLWITPIVYILTCGNFGVETALVMASEERRRRLDVKTQDREKSLSPLDKDRLKQRCLARVRSERSRHIARLRQKRDVVEEERAGFEVGASKLSLEVTGGQAEESSPPRQLLSSPREILRQGLSEMVAVKRQPSGVRTDQRANRLAQGRVSCLEDAIGNDEQTDCGANIDASGDPCSLLAIEEEAAYMTACSPAARAVRLTATSTGNLDSRWKEGERRQQGERAEEMDSDDLWFEDDAFPDERLLSSEEYLEMMQYIEEACKEEDIRAEAEVQYYYNSTTEQ